MLRYDIDGRILTIVAAGTTSAEDRQAFYQAAGNDERVPERALLLIDARTADEATGVHDLQLRAQYLAEGLGPKLGPLCAVIAPPKLAADATFFQAAVGPFGIRVGIFSDEPQARQWLADFAGQV
jgi:hypothetical protein